MEEAYFQVENREALLEQQLAIREKELQILRSDNDFKKERIERLEKQIHQSHILHEEEMKKLDEQISSMTETLVRAENSIESLVEEVDHLSEKLQKQKEFYSHREERLVKTLGFSKASRLRKALVVGTVAFALGIAPFLFVLSLPYLWREQPPQATATVTPLK